MAEIKKKNPTVQHLIAAVEHTVGGSNPDLARRIGMPLCHSQLFFFFFFFFGGGDIC